jgi:nitrite reductase (NO-forming)
MQDVRDDAPRLSDLLEDVRAHSGSSVAETDDPLAVVITDGALPGESLAASSPHSRRVFLARTSLLTLAIPGVGAAFAACSPRDNAPKVAIQDSTLAGAKKAPPLTGPTHNSDSRLDSAVLKGEHGATSATGNAAQSASSVAYHRRAPELPPIPAGSVQKLHFRTMEAPLRISDDTVIAAWTFEGDVPGPFVHTRVGDTVEFTLTNESDVPHSMDFHAAQIDPKVAFRSVVKGESLTFSFKPKYAGAFMYHCGTGPVLMHIGSGMFGVICVSPREPMPPARDFVLVQNEYYLADAVNGVHASDYTKMLSTMPDVVCFNGRPGQYIKDPIHVKVGERVRFWVVSAGPSHPCSFHVVGEQFDTVYLGSLPNNSIHGVQTFNVAPGGGMVFELVCDVVGEFPFVNHGFGHGQKGAIGILRVEA